MVTPKLEKIPSQVEINRLVDSAFTSMIRSIIMKKFGLEDRFCIEPEACGAKGAGALAFTREFLSLRKIDLATLFEIPLGSAGAKADEVTLVEINKVIPYRVEKIVQECARLAGEADAEADAKRYFDSLKLPIE